MQADLLVGREPRANPPGDMLVLLGPHTQCRGEPAPQVLLPLDGACNITHRPAVPRHAQQRSHLQAEHVEQGLKTVLPACAK